MNVRWRTAGTAILTAGVVVAAVAGLLALADIDPISLGTALMIAAHVGLGLVVIGALALVVAARSRVDG